MPRERPGFVDIVLVAVREYPTAVGATFECREEKVNVWACEVLVIGCARGSMSGLPIQPLKVSPFSQNCRVSGSAIISVFGNHARQTA
jgi:hypothetical protein